MVSTNRGLDWTQYPNDGQEQNPDVSALCIDAPDIIAGVGGCCSSPFSGVWRRPLSDFGISSVAQTPASAKPEIHIYPNPFSQSTQITFTSETPGYAEVSIMNMLGVEVARLLTGELGDGEHSLSWSNPTGLPDGVYECLVRMNGQVQTLPVVLMKN